MTRENYQKAEEITVAIKTIDYHVQNAGNFHPFAEDKGVFVDIVLPFKREYVKKVIAALEAKRKELEGEFNAL